MPGKTMNPNSFANRAKRTGLEHHNRNAKKKAKFSQEEWSIYLQDELAEAHGKLASKDEVLQELSQREYQHQEVTYNANMARLRTQRENARLRAEIMLLKAEVASLKARIPFEPPESNPKAEERRILEATWAMQPTPSELKQWREEGFIQDQ